VEDREQVLRVVVDLRPLALREDVLEVERMPAEALSEQLRVGRVQRLEVNPGEAAGCELLNPGLRLAQRDVARGRASSGPRQAWQAGHRY